MRQPIAQSHPVPKPPPQVSEWLSEQSRKKEGGKYPGLRRGDSDYYAELARRSHVARRKKDKR